MYKKFATDLALAFTISLKNSFVHLLFEITGEKTIMQKRSCSAQVTLNLVSSVTLFSLGKLAEEGILWRNVEEIPSTSPHPPSCTCEVNELHSVILS